MEKKLTMDQIVKNAIKKGISKEDVEEADNAKKQALNKENIR